MGDVVSRRAIEEESEITEAPPFYAVYSYSVSDVPSGYRPYKLGSAADDGDSREYTLFYQSNNLLYVNLSTVQDSPGSSWADWLASEQFGGFANGDLVTNLLILDKVDGFPEL